MLFDIDFYKFWVNNTPTQRRKPKRNARGKVYTRPLVWLRELVFTDLMSTGPGAVKWDATVQYNQLNKVVYNANKQLYQVLEGVTPPVGTLPTDEAYFRVLSTNWVGRVYQQQATAEKLKLEYYLNLYFFSSYRQPPLVSDIYIETVPADDGAFIVGLTEQGSSAVTYLGDNINGAIFADNITVLPYNFKVWVPSALFTALGTTLAEREAKVKAQVNPRNLQSVNYIITTY